MTLRSAPWFIADFDFGLCHGTGDGAFPAQPGLSRAGAVTLAGAARDRDQPPAAPAAAPHLYKKRRHGGDPAGEARRDLRGRGVSVGDRPLPAAHLPRDRDRLVERRPGPSVRGARHPMAATDGSDPGPPIRFRSGRAGEGHAVRRGACASPAGREPGSAASPHARSKPGSADGAKPGLLPGQAASPRSTSSSSSTGLARAAPSFSPTAGSAGRPRASAIATSSSSAASAMPAQRSTLRAARG